MIETRHIITCDQCLREELEVRSEWAGIKEAKQARWDHHPETGFWCPFCREAASRRADLYKDPQAMQGPINEIMRQLTPDELALHRRESLVPSSKESPELGHMLKEYHGKKCR